MATQEMTSDVLTSFCQVWKKKKTSDLTEAYYRSFRKYTDDEIKEAAYKCLESCEFFPKPVQVIQRITQRKEESPEDYLIKDKANCHECERRDVLCISEPKGDPWQCRQCYTGLTAQEIIDKFQVIEGIIDGKSKDLDNRLRKNRIKGYNQQPRTNEQH